MSTPKGRIHNQTGRASLDRDNQQWVLDYVIQQTGRTFHFQSDSRGDLPKSVKSHAMISKHLGKQAAQLERSGDALAAQDHHRSALDFHFEAVATYAKAQHTVFEMNAERRYLFDGLKRNFAKVQRAAPYELEHLTIPWEDGECYGNLHLNPAVSGPAPLLFYIPGCDTFKETYTHPYRNFAHDRGMHLFSFDGPGHAESTMNGTKLTADNHERAASAALDVLLSRPEVDPDAVVVYANSFGTFWGLRFAAADHRIKAIAATQISMCDKFIQTDVESPRWKQLFAFLTQAESEEELDTIMSAMTMNGYMERIECPVLLTAGEFDPRSPLDEVYDLYDQLAAPAELWVMADQHHALNIGPRGSGAVHGVVSDWLLDRLGGKPLRHPGEVQYLPKDAMPGSSKVEVKRHWFEA